MAHTLDMSSHQCIPEKRSSDEKLSDNEHSAKIADAIRSLLSTLPQKMRERLLEEMLSEMRPIQAPRAGEVLGTVVRLLRRQPNWTTEQIREEVSKEGVEASNKEVYNALGYLTRRGHVRRVGYGRYIIDGVGVVTSEDLSVEPWPTED